MVVGEVPETLRGGCDTLGRPAVRSVTDRVRIGCPTFIEISFRMTRGPKNRVSKNEISVANPALTVMY